MDTIVKQVNKVRYTPFYNNKRKIKKGCKRNCPKVLRRKRNICMNISTYNI